MTETSHCLVKVRSFCDLTIPVKELRHN